MWCGYGGVGQGQRPLQHRARAGTTRGGKGRVAAEKVWWYEESGQPLQIFNDGIERRDDLEMSYEAAFI